MKFNSLHYALLAVLVLLMFYAASTYGLFKEGGTSRLEGYRTPSYSQQYDQG